MDKKIVIKKMGFTCQDGFLMPALYVCPSTQEKLPAILFIYEAFGMNKEMERLACEFAKEGFAVLMPDLFQRGSWFQCLRQMMRDLKNENGRTVEDLLSARQILCLQPEVIPDQVSVVGLCMGGGFALVLSKTKLFQVAAPFYGQVPLSLKGACPIVGSYGERDEITRKDRHRLIEQVNEHQIKADIKVYPGAGHSFMNEAPNLVLGMLTRVLPAHAAHDRIAEDDARKRVTEFIKSNL